MKMNTLEKLYNCMLYEQPEILYPRTSRKSIRIGSTNAGIEQVNRIDMNWRDYIASDPTIMFGKPVIKGTRVPVDLILEKLGNGETMEQLLESYPSVTETAFTPVCCWHRKR